MRVWERCRIGRCRDGRGGELLLQGPSFGAGGVVSGRRCDAMGDSLSAEAEAERWKGRIGLPVMGRQLRGMVLMMNSWTSQGKETIADTQP